MTAESDVAVVTGAARGLGAVIAARLHGHGLRVALADVDVDEAAEVASHLDPSHATARAFALDVRERASFHDLLAGVVAVWGGLHVVVNNAASTQATPVMQISAEEFDSVVGVNLSGTFNGCQILGGYLADNGYGRIVNIGSLAGQNGGTATGAHYAASKGGIHTLTKVFARELAASGVTVNAVAPGPLDLPVVHRLVPPERMGSLIATIPVGRLGSPGFVAQVVVLLASRDASSVTGACWDVNGGLHLR
ncbi:SDR family NAD(P)-dependent oxidoreductase [Pseudonocardia sp. CA-142604]|uniref:SDR family NAD(P)-dependent oxidoreductase n=1 Tax=Pseudonocardia sp. CA-142604 TaxID=3240024 RepID=UPI003D901172